MSIVFLVALQFEGQFAKSTYAAHIEVSSKVLPTLPSGGEWGKPISCMTCDPLSDNATCSLGAPIGGIINDSLSWRWAFWAQVRF